MFVFYVAVMILYEILQHFFIEQLNSMPAKQKFIEAMCLLRNIKHLYLVLYKKMGLIMIKGYESDTVHNYITFIDHTVRIVFAFYLTKSIYYIMMLTMINIKLHETPNTNINSIAFL